MQPESILQRDTHLESLLF